MTVIYSARWVLPIISPVIEYGAIACEGSLILGAGPRTEIVSRFPEAHIQDFGDAAILPGLVNAHSHLELTVMRGFLEREENDFSAWLRRLTLARLAMTAEDLLVSATCGAIEAARAGVTCVGDASSVASQAIAALKLVGLRGIVYQESFGPDPSLAAENVATLREQIAELRALENALVRIGVSPHAPYTVSAPQLELISRLAIDESLPVMMHAAESESERLFMLEGQGVFADKLRERGIEWQAPGISTIQYLSRHGVLETRPLLAHCINVDDRDLELIKQSSAGIAHCPKSNAKLGHGRAPFAEFIKRDLNLGLGSDSMASNNACDLLEEGRFAALLARLPSNSNDPFRKGRLPAPDLISAEEALYAATLGGARALGLNDKIGALADGMQADIAIVSLNGTHQQPVRDPVVALVFASSGRDVLLTMVAGKEICRDGRVSGTDESELQKRLAHIRSKIELPV
ncbi:MAG: 5-methylthioadenosine/S-adenosylhomocysteine deaminase [Blastocatellia bacterium]|nr:5-methylthioadenosine/S-adenosylhomocysteine deaminase [Blastocatellia bacterium]